MKRERQCDDMVSGGLRLPRLISDGMVLQRGQAVRIWGWAEPFDSVSVCFAGKTYKCAAGDDGKWEVHLDKQEAGGPYSMEISAGSKSPDGACADRIVISDILVGDVWVCSGQSNMMTPILRLTDLFPEEIAESCSDQIRYFQVPERHVFDKKQEDLAGGRWVPAEPSNVNDFSAVSLFFASEIHRKYNVPVGIINASVGGTPAEAWMSEEALRGWPDFLRELEICKDDSYVSSVKKSDEAAMTEWFGKLNRADEGLRDENRPWYSNECDISDWRAVRIPTSWENIGLKEFCGSIWLKKEIDIPAELAGKPAVLRMGTIVDSDVTYVNGAEVGTVTYRYPPRKYQVPEGVLKAGKNIITVRTVSNTGEGEFVTDKPYRLEIGGHIIDLTGDWVYKVGVAMNEPLPEMTFFSYKPAGLFNGMISPLMNYVIKGILWYQGEANTPAPKEYYRLFTGLIADWRRQWKLGRLPFIYVQLHNFQRAVREPGPSNWAELRDAQLKALSMPDTAMAVAIDTGEWNDIHPLDKKTVAHRLALAAQKLVYGEDIISSGPIYSSMKKDGNRIIISFREPTGGLISKDGGKLKHFAIAGSDRRFAWADAVIADDCVIVWNDTIDDPAAVRYAWADNPEGANLYNKAGLPASPFRTDDWES